MNKQAEECRKQIKELNQKLRECKELLKTETDRVKIANLKNRKMAIQQALKDIKIQLEHFDPQESVQKKTKRIIASDSFNFDFFERSKEVWSDLEGKNWKQVQEEQFILKDGNTSEDIQKWMAEGAKNLTEKQTICTDEYYNNGLSVEAIAKKYNIKPSSVSRTMSRGIKRMENWVEAKKLIIKYLKPDGSFDWMRYLEEAKVISDRQRELLLIVLTNLPESYGELARKLELNVSTVSRTLKKATNTIEKLEVKGSPSELPNIKNWDEADKWSLAIQLGMPLYFYYRFCFDRKERYCGLTRYKYELVKRVKAGKTPEEISKEFGISLSTAKSQYSEIKRKKLHCKINSFNTIGENISDDIYVKLQQLINGHNEITKNTKRKEDEKHE